MMQKMIERYKHNPVLFVREVVGAEPSSDQIQMLESVNSNRMTAVKSGHGVGKTTTLAWTILWFMTTRPYPKIPCTAPTMHQLRDILWAELAKWLNKSAVLKVLFDWTIERLTLKNNSENWFAVARTASKPDAMQGFHSESLLFVIDEASGVDDIVFEPILGALTGEETKLIMVGNPTKLTGFFHDAFTQNRNKFNCITLNAENNPRVSRDFIQSIIDLYGKDSDPYRVRVIGEFPKAEADTFIPLDILERSQIDSVSLLQDVTKVCGLSLGIDVARFGDDESTIYLTLDLGDRFETKLYKVFASNTTVELSGETRALIRQLNDRYKNIKVKVNIDGGGVGAGVVDELDFDHKNLNYEVIEQNFGGDGGRLEEEPMLYSNNTGLMWGNVKRLLMKNKLFIERDNELIAQFSSRKYMVDDDGRIKLERKQDMKKRGIHSPDRADGLALSLASNISRRGFMW